MINEYKSASCFFFFFGDRVEFPNEERVVSGADHVDHVHVCLTFNDLKVFFEFPNDERVIVSGTDHVDHVHVGHTFIRVEFPNFREDFCRISAQATFCLLLFCLPALP